MTDSDGDGIPDVFEREVLGTDPNKRDSDGDGLNDRRGALARDVRRRRRHRRRWATRRRRGGHRWDQPSYGPDGAAEGTAVAARSGRPA
ncbi:hypothetical protein [Ilumatobacter sp. SYSU D60003]